MGSEIDANRRRHPRPSRLHPAGAQSAARNCREAPDWLGLRGGPPLPALDDVIIATDSDEIIAVCHRHGWKAQMTSTAHRSGTERVHEISQSVAADIYLNVQGDEPMTRREHIAGLIEVMQQPAVQVGTLMTAAAPADIDNPSAVKVVTDSARTGSLFLPRNHSLRSRRRRAEIFQASRLLRLSQAGAGPLRRAAGVLARAQRAPGTIALPGERNPDSRGARPLRHRRRGYRRRPAARGTDSRFTFLVFRIGCDYQNRSGGLRMALWIFFHSSLTCRATSGFILRS